MNKNIKKHRALPTLAFTMLCALFATLPMFAMDGEPAPRSRRTSDLSSNEGDKEMQKTADQEARDKKAQEEEQTKQARAARIARQNELEKAQQKNADAERKSIQEARDRKLAKLEEDIQAVKVERDLTQKTRDAKLARTEAEISRIEKAIELTKQTAQEAAQKARESVPQASLPADGVALPRFGESVPLSADDHFSRERLARGETSGIEKASIPTETVAPTVTKSMFQTFTDGAKNLRDGFGKAVSKAVDNLNSWWSKYRAKSILQDKAENPTDRSQDKKLAEHLKKLSAKDKQEAFNAWMDIQRTKFNDRVAKISEYPVDTNADAQAISTAKANFQNEIDAITAEMKRSLKPTEVLATSAKADGTNIRFEVIDMSKIDPTQPLENQFDDLIKSGDVRITQDSLTTAVSEYYADKITSAVNNNSRVSLADHIETITDGKPWNDIDSSLRDFILLEVSRTAKRTSNEATLNAFDAMLTKKITAAEIQAAQAMDDIFGPAEKSAKSTGTANLDELFKVAKTQEKAAATGEAMAPKSRQERLSAIAKEAKLALKEQVGKQTAIELQDLPKEEAYLREAKTLAQHEEITQMMQEFKEKIAQEQERLAKAEELVANLSPENSSQSIQDLTATLQQSNTMLQKSAQEIANAQQTYIKSGYTGRFDDLRALDRFFRVKSIDLSPNSPKVIQLSVEERVTAENTFKELSNARDILKDQNSVQAIVDAIQGQEQLLLDFKGKVEEENISVPEQGKEQITAVENSTEALSNKIQQKLVVKGRGMGKPVSLARATKEPSSAVDFGTMQPLGEEGKSSKK
ncbi:MAG: hypothetical protein WC747_04775 [Candidatus Babeliales bacterium]|jgi:hypothetical protein